MEALLSLRLIKECFLNIVDPIAVQNMNRACIGQTVTFSIGVGYAPAFYQPVTFTGWVCLICDGAFKAVHGDLASVFKEVVQRVKAYRV